MHFGTFCSRHYQLATPNAFHVQLLHLIHLSVKMDQAVIKLIKFISQEA